MTSLQQLPQLPQSQAPIPACHRTYLTDENKLALVKLCVENQADFQERRKGQFWMMISGLLEQEIGVSLKDPAGTVKGFIANRRIQLRIQNRESGTVQEDTEFTQAIDKWMEVEEDRERIKEIARQPKDQAIREAHDAERHRSNLLRSAHLKRHFSSCSSDGEEDDTSEEKGENGQEAISSEGHAGSEGEGTMAATVKEIGSLRKKTRRIAAREDTHEMTAAVKGMGDAVALVAEKIGSRAENLGKVHEMEHRLEKMEEYLRKDGEIRKEQADHVQEQQVKTNQLLEGILLKLGEK